MTDRDRTYLRHIAERVARIEAMTARGHDAYLERFEIQDSIIRSFEVIGEATKRLSDEVKAAAPEVPWREIARFRDVLIHHYIGVDLSLVWETAQRDVPVLKAAAARFLET